MLEGDLQQFLDQARSGDADARDRLFEHFRPRLEPFVSKRMGRNVRRWAESGDLVQQVLFEVLSRLDALPPSADGDEVMRRLHQVATWRMRDTLRNQREEGESAAPGGPAGEAAPESSEGTVTRGDARRWLEELVLRLPPDYADVVRLCGLEGCGYVEAGRRLGISEDAVRKRYVRARDALRRKLGAARGS